MKLVHRLNNLFFQERTENKNRLFLYGIPLLLLLVAFTVKAVSLAYSDYAAYYFGSQQLLLGNYKIAYDTASLNLAIQTLGFKELFVSYTPFPPFTSVFFALFTLLPIGISKILFNTISCFLFLFTLIRSIKYFSIHPLFLLLVPIVFYTPIRSNLFFGQSYLLLFCLLIEGFMAYKKGQTLLSASLWGLAILFKVFPALIFFYLLIKKEYRQVLYMGGICFLLLIISIAVNGVSPWRLYITNIFPRLNNGELNDSFTFIFQSAFMLFKNIFIYDEVLNTKAIYPNPFLFYTVLALFKAFIVAICVLVTLKKNPNDFLSFALWITASILISPNGSTYSQVLLLIPLLALFSSDITVIQKVITAGLVLLINNVPVHYFASLPLLLKFPRLYLLIAFFITMTMIVKIRFDYKIISGVILLFLLLESPRLYKETDYSTYFFNEDKHILTYDYAVKEDKIISYYWSEKGGEADTTNYKVQNYSAKDLILKDNQIYYKGKQMTASPDWKKKPLLLDKECIVYLSDKNRGVGFYTLRKIKLNGENWCKGVDF